MEIPGIYIVVGGLAITGSLLCIRQLSARLREATTALRAEREASSRKDATIQEGQDIIKLRKRSNRELRSLLKEKSDAMPWIAEMVADVYWAHDARDARQLEMKKHPAQRAAEMVREHALEKKRLRIEKRLVEYRIALIKSLFPWLQDVGFADAEKIAEAQAGEAAQDGDPAAQWLSKDEWLNLSVSDRNQRALDCYKKRAKSDWEIGRDLNVSLAITGKAMVTTSFIMERLKDSMILAGT